MSQSYGGQTLTSERSQWPVSALTSEPAQVRERKVEQSEQGDVREEKNNLHCGEPQSHTSLSSSFALLSAAAAFSSAICSSWLCTRLETISERSLVASPTRSRRHRTSFWAWSSSVCATACVGCIKTVVL